MHRSVATLMQSILAKVDWPKVSRQSRTESRNRECYQPLVSMYRWWARRPHALMGAIIQAASEQLPAKSLVADPFSGGGTVAIECIQRSLSVYAQDVNPWPSWGL